MSKVSEIIYLLTKKDYQDEVEEVKILCKDMYEVDVEVVLFDEVFPIIEEVKCFVYLDDISIKKFLKENIEENLFLSILPNKMCPDAMDRYGISKDIKEALEDGFNEKLNVKDHLLFCNNQLVFKKVSIGNINNFNQSSDNNSIFKKLKLVIQNFFSLKYQFVTIETLKENVIKTVFSGMLIVENYTAQKQSFQDGKLNAFVIAPYSLVSYLSHLISIFLYHKSSSEITPKNIGFISSKQIKLSSNTPFGFKVDGVLLNAKDMDIRIVDSNFKISYGRKFESLIEQKNSYDDKESVVVKCLPKGEINELLVKGRVPFFRKASDDDMKETLIQVKSSARVSSIFIVLMILSTLLATVGIFQDSTPVVIGAMILAPLMAPIISFSMGAVRSDRYIISQSIKTLSLGISASLFFSALFSLVLPLENITSQINSRINPNLLDLFVAIFSGIAGAYATSKEEVAKSFAGVAIAVALVPPLAVTGIGIGWLDFEIVYGSFLLFLTNFFGVVLAASLTFLVLGYAPVFRAKKGLIYSTVLLSIICIPLIFSFYSMVLQNTDFTKLSEIKHMTLNEKKVELKVTHIHHSTKKIAHVEIEVISKTTLSDDEFDKIHKNFELIIGKKVILQMLNKRVKVSSKGI